MTEPKVAWVLLHSYHHEGEPLILRVYLDGARATADYELLKNERQINSSEYKLVEAPLISP